MMINIKYSNIIINAALSFGEIPVQLARLMAAQSAHETNNFTSNNFIKNNNGFGYKFVKGAKLQLTTSGIHSTESDNYAAYATFEDSIKEVCLWILRRRKEARFPQDLTAIQNPEQYAKLLKQCGYYGGKEQDYANGLNFFLKQIIEYTNVNNQNKIT